MKRLSLILLSLVLAASIASGCKPKEEVKKPKKKPATVEKLRFGYVGVSGVATHRDLLVAKEKGFFKANGVNVELAPLAAEDVLPAMIGGRLEGGTAPPISALMAIEKGADLKLVASGVQFKKAGLSWIVVRKDSPIKTVADLNGKTNVTWPKGTCIWSWVKAFEKEQGIAFSQIIEATTGKTEMLLGGTVDVTDMGWTGIVGTYKDQVRAIAPLSAVTKIGCSTNALWFRGDFLRKHPEAVRGFINALQQAREYIADNPVETIQIAVKYTAGADFERYKQMWEQGWFGWDFPPEMLVEVWQLEEAQKLNLELGFMAKPLDTKKYVDTRFAKPVWKMPKGELDWLQDIKIPEN